MSEDKKGAIDLPADVMVTPNFAFFLPKEGSRGPWAVRLNANWLVLDAELAALKRRVEYQTGRIDHLWDWLKENFPEKFEEEC